MSTESDNEVGRVEGLVVAEAAAKHLADSVEDNGRGLAGGADRQVLASILSFCLGQPWGFPNLLLQLSLPPLD